MQPSRVSDIFFFFFSPQKSEMKAGNRRGCEPGSAGCSRGRKQTHTHGHKHTRLNSMETIGGRKGGWKNMATASNSPPRFEPSPSLSKTGGKQTNNKKRENERDGQPAVHKWIELNRMDVWPNPGQFSRELGLQLQFLSYLLSLPPSFFPPASLSLTAPNRSHSSRTKG